MATSVRVSAEVANDAKPDRSTDEEGCAPRAGAGMARGFMSAHHFLTAIMDGDALLLAQLFSSCVLFSLKIMWKRLAFYYCY